jgi:hypothetical protein
MNLLNLEEEKYKNVKIGGYEFKIRFISPQDSILITRRRQTMQGGAPVESLLNTEFQFMDNIATVDVCTESYPKGFDQTESCVKWPDATLINELANAIREHTAEFEAKLKKNRPVS